MGGCLSRAGHKAQPSLPAATERQASSRQPSDQFPDQETMLAAILEKRTYRSEAAKQAEIAYLTKGKAGSTPMPPSPSPISGAERAGAGGLG